MVVKIEVSNTQCKIINKLNTTQLSVLQEICSFTVEGSEFKKAQYKSKSIDWDGRRKLFNIQYQTFPIGLLSLICKTFNNAGINTEIISNRKNASNNISYHMNNTFEMRDYQTQAVIASILHGNGIIKAATGAGKTTIAARTIGGLRGRAIFIVPTRDLLYQTKNSFSKIFCEETIGQIGDGKIDYQNITVATIQSLAILGDITYSSYKYDEEKQDKEILNINKYDKTVFKKYINTVDILMFDEVQRICSRTAYAIRFMFDKSNYAFGYSASPWRDDGSDLMITASFGDRICDISASELIDKGYLVQPTIIIKNNTNCLWDGTEYGTVYRTAIVENMFRNMMIVQDAIDYYNQHKNTLILVTQLKHGEIIQNMLNNMDIPAIFISGKSGMKKRTKIITDMRNGNCPIVIASTIADVGLDVPRLEVLIEAGAGKSSVTALQRLGRIMRPFPGKSQCTFITYDDNVPYIAHHIKKKINIWSTEPNFIIRYE